MTGALALTVALSVASQIQVHPTGLKSVGLSHGRSGVRTVQILDKLYEQAGKPSLDLDMARYKDLHDNATGETSLVSFTRSSMGTYVGSDGLIKRSAVNELLYSEQFDNAAWVKSDVTVSANQTISPDGKQTADHIIENSATAPHFLSVYRAISYITGYTFSFYAKADGSGRYAYSQIAPRDPARRFGVVVDLSDGSILQTKTYNSPSNPSVSVENVGNGWFRIALTAFALSGNTAVSGYIGTADDTTLDSTTFSGYTGDGTSGIYIWGAQLEEGTTATPYIRTTSTISGAPRFDHDPVTGESLGLLVEEARTNLLTYSEQFDNPTWNPQQATVSANATVAPDGKTTADKLVSAVGTGLYPRLRRLNTLSNTTQTVSLYAKKAEWRYAAISQDGYRVVYYDLQDGLVVSQDTSTGTISDAGDGWYRLVYSYTSTESGITRALTITAGNTPSYGAQVGDGTSGIYIWGAQLEAGAFPTSYIPTTTVAVTRAADIAAVEGADFSTTNLLSYSESFDVGWTRQAINAFGAGSVANAIVAPDGRTTADYLQENNTTASHQVYLVNVPIVSGTTYTFSVYAKAAERTAVAFNSSSAAFGTQEFATYDLASGTVGAQGTSGSATIQAVGNGWYRLTRTITSTASITTGAAWGLSNSPTAPRLASYAGDGTSGIYLWGASLTATEYPVAYTTTRNLLTDSQDFERGTWAKQNLISVQNNIANAPDGTPTADGLVAVSGAGTYRGVYKAELTPTPKTLSAYVKKGTKDYAFLLGYSGNSNVWFNLANGTVNTVGVKWTNAAITDEGDGWYRISAEMNAVLAGNNVGIYFSDADNSTTCTSDGTSVIGYIWGAQLEPGTVATDYVRTVDAVGKAYRWYEPTEGTVYAIASTPAIGTRGIVGIDDNTANERIELQTDGTDPEFVVIDGGAGSTLDTGTITAYTFFNLTGAYKHNDLAATVGGLAVQTATDTVPTVDRMRVGALQASGTYLNGHIKRLTYWPQRKPDATLQVITQ